MPATFTFGLQRVRDLRAREEEHARVELAGALRARTAGQDALEELEGRLRDAQRTQPAATAGAPRVGGSDLLAHQAWLQRLESSTGAARQELVRHDEAVTGRRGLLEDAGRRREALDRLRERRLDEHRLHEGRREAAELDEMALRAHRSAA